MPSSSPVLVPTVSGRAARGRPDDDPVAHVWVPSASGSVRHITVPVATPIALEPGLTVSVGASVGIATGPPGEVVHLADAALHVAKRAERSPGSSTDARPG